MLAIVNGKVLTITNGTLDEGVVLIEEGKIKAVGKDIPIPEGAEVIDAKGKMVTPGLIDSHSHLAVFGEPSVWANSDGNEVTDPITPHLRGIDALNPNDPAIKDVLTGGVTTVYTGPGSANLIGGTGFAMKLRGRTVDEMVIPGTEAMKMALGENPKRVYGQGQKRAPNTRMGNAAVLREALVKAQNYMNKMEKAQEKGKSEENSTPPERDLKMEALGRVLRREIKARIHAHRADDIMTAIRIAEEFNLDYIIEHCTEGYKIADILGARKVRATVGPLLMSRSKMELLDVSLANPGILAKAGVTVAIQCDSTSGTRWLACHTGLAVREGMPEDLAMEAITIVPAQILGIDDRVGSLEVGKDADLVIWNGHPFNTLTVAEKVFIEGELVYERKNS
ncbi:MAG TPA: amidohydrolase [Bacillota bacterium]|nr:amidohydrolase [Candidatus Fermentithermobacillaceae bacterium]HOB30150.1 amidohydrolase [Bacillota bacterium]HOK64040.1 amidohydrolase [Bacillota bacterium]HOL11395.1 amidohydrolase [Bacillota bacterium]HOQ02524.1 amidohydrolase [Bacillota bacterium]